MIVREVISGLINATGFSLIDGSGEKYRKKYGTSEIILDIPNNKIIYPAEIITGRNTTANFNHPENLVVLECVDRLLTMGYSANCIELERSFGAGRLDQGQWLDILVKRSSGTAFAMIECKTYGAEHDKEHNKMIKSGGQLINYFLNHRDVDFLILYSSEINTGTIKPKSEILSTSAFKHADSREHLLELWDKTFENNGFFDTEPYDFSPGIRKKDLIEITYGDIYSTEGGGPKGTIFYRFAEILRRHAASDKSNAYNKIFNLFLCKIVDEDEKNDNDEMDFQWKKDETAEDVIGRMSELYKKGMKKYLDLSVTDHSESELERAISSDLSERALQIFREVRLYKDNEFAFKEVINKQTFDENARVVKEVVKLLEPYQIKYSTKQQFLGDFFERLLNIGIKQESGQFFTPIPIAKFMINSLPVDDIIAQKIAAKEANFLPYIIDYACGSGHFLTEAMSRIEGIITEMPEIGLTKPQLDNLRKWKAAPYSWCSEFVYGIEKDYRLAKTTKVASFLNGDGEANIIYGDGLDSFNSPTYRGILKLDSDDNYNEQFDLVIANPPFSVEGFKETLEKGRDNFELFKFLGDSSDDIECLFVERTAQLLGEGKYAAVILPNSILSNKGVHFKARELLLRDFEIIGVQELGNNVFAATGNNTVILFLQRKESSIHKWNQLGALLSKFGEDGKDFNFTGIQNIVSRYCDIVLGGVSVKEFKESANNNPDELTKLKMFAITHGQGVVISRFPQVTEEAKAFLGYEHSQRDKYEGIHPFPRSRTETKITSKLYDDVLLNDPGKVSTYLLANYRGDPMPEIDSSLFNHMSYRKLSELISYHVDNFTAKIKLDGAISLSIAFGTTEQLISLSDDKLFTIKKGQSITRIDVQGGNVPVIAGGQSPAYYHNRSNRSGSVITVSASGAYAGFVNYYDTPIWASDCNTIQLTAAGEKSIVLPYLYLVLKSAQTKLYAFNTGNTNGHVYAEDLKNIKLLVPSKELQEKVIAALFKKASLITEEDLEKVLRLESKNRSRAAIAA